MKDFYYCAVQCHLSTLKVHEDEDITISRTYTCWLHHYNQEIGVCWIHFANESKLSVDLSWNSESEFEFQIYDEKQKKNLFSEP
jgi:hypothetical protein